MRNQRYDRCVGRQWTRHLYWQLSCHLQRPVPLDTLPGRAAGGHCMLRPCCVNLACLPALFISFGYTPHSTASQHTMDALLAPVTAAMQDGRFDEVATSLDEAELHVREIAAMRRAITRPPVSWPDRSTVCVQDPSAFSMERWPHALHLLAHIYAARL